MPYAGLFREGEKPTPDKPRLVPIGDCIGKLGLRKHHRTGSEPPKIPSQKPGLDDIRDPYGTVVHLRGDDAPSEWMPGWYMIPASDLPTSQARKILEGYPLVDWSDYMSY